MTKNVLLIIEGDTISAIFIKENVKHHEVFQIKEERTQVTTINIKTKERKLNILSSSKLYRYRYCTTLKKMTILNFIKHWAKDLS